VTEETIAGVDLVMKLISLQDNRCKIISSTLCCLFMKMLLPALRIQLFPVSP
jgi:hypothetical protein